MMRAFRSKDPEVKNALLLCRVDHLARSARPRCSPSVVKTQ
jgi:hypothetical protein